MFCVYVLKSDGNEIYIGHTDNLKRRILSHNSGANIATMHQSDWKLVHSEEYLNRQQAVRRENFLKTGDGRRVLKNKGILI